MKLTFAERHRQAKLYAYQVWVRKQMAEQYAHHRARRSPNTNPQSRRAAP